MQSTRNAAIAETTEEPMIIGGTLPRKAINRPEGGTDILSTVIMLPAFPPSPPGLSMSHYQNLYAYRSKSGPKLWVTLSSDMLSEDGKIIVSMDPDLGTETLHRLQRTEPQTKRQYKFSFGIDDVGEGTAGLANLSSCIKDNLNQTMAELVARYAMIRDMPFLVTATALDKLRNTHGFIYYSSAESGFRPISWQPASPQIAIV